MTSFEDAADGVMEINAMAINSICVFHIYMFIAISTNCRAIQVTTVVVGMAKGTSFRCHLMYIQTWFC